MALNYTDGLAVGQIRCY